MARTRNGTCHFLRLAFSRSRLQAVSLTPSGTAIRKAASHWRSGSVRSGARSEKERFARGTHGHRGFRSSPPPGNDEHCLDGGAYDAPCGDADVHAHRRAERRHNCLHPRPALADLITTARSRYKPLPAFECGTAGAGLRRESDRVFQGSGDRIGQEPDYPRRPSGFLRGRRGRRPSRSRGARTMNCRGRPRSIASENACAGAPK